MSVTIQTGDILMVRLGFRLGTDRAYNMLHYRVQNVTSVPSGLPAAVPIPADTYLPIIAQNLYATMTNAWRNGASSQVRMDELMVQKIRNTPRSEPYTFIDNEAEGGVVVGDALPLQDTPTLLKKTGIGERWGQGRLYYVGVAEASAANGYLNGAGVAGLQPFIDALEADFATGDADFNVVIQPVLFSEGPGGVRINDITRVILSNNTIKTQRRRRPGKGI